MLQHDFCSSPQFIRGLKGASMSFWRLFYHLVWSTKYRKPLITPEIEPNLFAYLVHKAVEIGVYVYAINGWTDHIHLVAAIPPHLSVAEVVKKLKGSSSHFINQELVEGHSFAWQRGYGVLSVGEAQKNIPIDYVHNQKKYHQNGADISWLERLAETEDGPAVNQDNKNSVLHEPSVGYILENIPF